MNESNLSAGAIGESTINNQDGLEDGEYASEKRSGKKIGKDKVIGKGYASERDSDTPDDSDQVLAYHHRER
jgi:hypothetical protein